MLHPKQCIQFPEALQPNQRTATRDVANQAVQSVPRAVTTDRGDRSISYQVSGAATRGRFLPPGTALAAKGTSNFLSVCGLGVSHFGLTPNPPSAGSFSARNIISAMFRAEEKLRREGGSAQSLMKRKPESSPFLWSIHELPTRNDTPSNHPKTHAHIRRANAAMVFCHTWQTALGWSPPLPLMVAAGPPARIYIPVRHHRLTGV